MTVTINTDASFCHQTKATGYAFWIVCDRGKILKSGNLKGAVTPLECEMKCLANALHILEKSEYNDGGISKIYINSDCKNMFKRISLNTTCQLGKHIFQSISRIKKLRKDQTFKKFYELRHVKAHNGTKDARSYVNDWCDREAGKWMRLQRASIRLQNQT